MIGVNGTLMRTINFKHDIKQAQSLRKKRTKQTNTNKYNSKPLKAQTTLFDLMMKVIMIEMIRITIGGRWTGLQKIVQEIANDKIGIGCLFSTSLHRSSSHFIGCYFHIFDS